MSDNLVPGPQATIFDAVNSVVNDEQAAQAIMANPSLAKDVDANGVRGHGKDDGCCGGQGCGCQGDGEIPLKAVDEIGRATAAGVREALHQVIDPELGIDVVDLGLVYGIEIDELGRAIIGRGRRVGALRRSRPRAVNSSPHSGSTSTRCPRTDQPCRTRVL